MRFWGEIDVDEALARQLIEQLQKSIAEAAERGADSREWASTAQAVLESTGSRVRLVGPQGDHELAYAVFVAGSAEQASAKKIAAGFSSEGRAFAEYWRFLAIQDHRNDSAAKCPGILCRSLHGKVFRKDDEAALIFWPPVHFLCRCGSMEVPARLLERRGWYVTTGADAIAAVGRPATHRARFHSLGGQ